MRPEDKEYSVEHYYLEDDGVFPNSHLPVLFYRNVLRVPPVFAATAVKMLFRKFGWGNAWKYGIFEYHHYHSITHEVLGIISGETELMLGGNHGITLNIRKGDVIIIPAGVAHKNNGRENQVTCIGAYPRGNKYDICYGYVGERPQADRNISQVSKPRLDPVFGNRGGLHNYW